MGISLNSPLCPAPLLLILLWNSVIPSPALFPTQCSSLGIKQEIGLVRARAEIQDEVYPPGSQCAFLSTCVQGNRKKKQNNFLFTDICNSSVKMKLLQVILHHFGIKGKRVKRPALETPCHILHMLSGCCRRYRDVGINEMKKKQTIVLRICSSSLHKHFILHICIFNTRHPVKVMGHRRLFTFHMPELSHQATHLNGAYEK